MRTRSLILFLLASCSGQSIDNGASEFNANETSAGEGSQAVASAGPIFDSVADLSAPSELERSVRGARPVEDPSDWSASFYILSGGDTCTASVVGEWVMLTAAHCVGNGGRATFRKAGVTYGAKCDHAPEYGQAGPEARTADYALCRLDRPIPGVAAERLNTQPQALQVNGEVSLTGFGCTENDGTGGNDNIYRIGEVKIARLPSGANNDIVTSGDVGVCFGDSGGPAFLRGPGRRRMQISVNSRVQNFGTEEDPDLGPKSYLSSITSDTARRFIDSWSQARQLRICGLHTDAKTCRPG